MTMPHERSRAVIQTEDFLHELMRDASLPQRIRKDAKFLLRHFPSRSDIFTAGLLEERFAPEAAVFASELSCQIGGVDLSKIGRDLRVREVRMLAEAEERILTTGDFLPYSELAKRCSGDSLPSQATVEVWETEQRIFSISNGGRVLYPCYAFSANGDPLPGLKEVVMVLSRTKKGWGMAFWLGSSNSFLGGRLPKHLLLTDVGSVVLAAEDEVAGIIQG
jgi:hypothetical protein